MDVYHQSTKILSTLRNRLVSTINVGLVVTVVFPSFSSKKPSELSNEGMIDEVNLNKKMEDAWEVRRLRRYGFTGLRFSLPALVCWLPTCPAKL